MSIQKFKKEIGLFSAIQLSKMLSGIKSKMADKNRNEKITKKEAREYQEKINLINRILVELGHKQMDIQDYIGY